MHTKEKEHLQDKIANILFTDKDTREFTESVIAASLGIPKSVVKDNLVLLSPWVNSTIKTQYSEVDAMYENIDFLKKMDYTKIMEAEEDSLEKLLYIFVCNDKDVLDRLYSENEIMDKVREKLSALTEDFAEDLYYNKQDIINAYSYDLGKEEGKTNREIEIAKSMLKDNISDSIIIKHTGLTKEELEKLKKH